MPFRTPDPYASWLQTAFGNVGTASAESRVLIKEKISCHGFSVAIRIGATGTKKSAPANISNLHSALKTLESAGVRITAESEKVTRFNAAHIPWSFKYRLSVKELSNFLLLPIGAVELPGADNIHPKTILPPSWYRSSSDRVFAKSMDGKTNLSISDRDSLEHTIILGPTGAGKSTVMQNLILSDIYAGKSVIVLDPKAELISSLLQRIPKSRDNDVVIIDPSDPCPVGINPLKGHQNPNLTADTVLSVFKEVFKDNWGIRSQDVLSAALLTLAQTEGASLLWLPILLTDETFRKKITSKIDDKLGLEPFWRAFNSMSETKRQTEIASVLNKIRQFLLRPGLRNVLGQSNPKFDLSDLFNKNKIVLVPLNKGLIGAESAKLLGSLIVGMTWNLSLSRAKIPAERRRIVSVYIDELQDYISSIGADFESSLAMARGLSVGFCVAHQYREQLPKEIRHGIDSNARNKIIFGLSASDAKDMAAMAPELKAVDFMTLPRHHVYASFQHNRQSTGWISGQTFRPMSPIREEIELKAKSMAEYGKPAEEIEAEYLAMLAETRRFTDVSPTAESIGRRRRT
jgi:energy-coupling factor transporter ATP-binding protein EcfA2